MDATPETIPAALHSVELRIVRLESEVVSLAREQITQAGRMDAFVVKIDALAHTVSKEFADLWKAVAQLQGYQRMTLWIVGVGLPFIAGLELWDRLFG